MTCPAARPVRYLSDGFTPERTPCRIEHIHRVIDGHGASRTDAEHCRDPYAYRDRCRECGGAAHR